MNRYGSTFVHWVAALLIFLSSQGAAYAFHEGGVGYCEGCHNLHSPKNQVPNSEEGSGKTSPGSLLRGSDPSSTCLRCHAERGASHNIFSSDGSSYTPGGDFYWLKKTFTWDSNGHQDQSPGDSHGHNIISLDYGLNQDMRLSAAPGGTYPAASLGCTSCHDPHGKISGNHSNQGAISVSGSYSGIPANGTVTGNYRLLGGIGYSGGEGSGISFNSSAPVAVAAPDNWTETDANHPAYGSGMSEWCANCHANILNGGTSMGGTSHPSGSSAKLSSAMISDYNSYIRTGDLTGAQATAYLALVPFEHGTEDLSLLDPSSTSGPEPGGQANVMCLTCHRAHASAFQNMGRWDFKTTFISDSMPQTGATGASGNDVTNSYYGRDMIAAFGKYQRPLCNKCHVKD